MESPQTQIHKIQLACLFQPHRNILGVFQGQPTSGMHFIGIQADPKGQPRTDCFSNGIDDFKTETEPVVKISAVVVFPEIGGRR